MAAVLADLEEVLRGLVALAEEKLRAMRTADAAALHACAARERSLLADYEQVEQRRRAVFARWAQGMRGVGAAGRDLGVRLGEIAEGLGEPQRSQILAKSEGLRHLAEKLRSRNELAVRVAQHLHRHIAAVFAEVADAQQELIGYGPAGRHERRLRAGLVDAVG